MNKDKFVFAQLVQFMDQFKFLRLVKKYYGDNRHQKQSWQSQRAT